MAIYSLFHNHGKAKTAGIGAPMSITEHSVQTALAAKKAGETVEVQLAACCTTSATSPASLGGPRAGWTAAAPRTTRRWVADFLAALGLPDTVSYLARHDVDAKRYLCAVDPEYHARLSDARRGTLKHQQ